MRIFNAVLQGVMPARCLEATLTDSDQFELRRLGQTVCKWWRRNLGSIGLPACLPACLPVCLSVCLSACLRPCLPVQWGTVQCCTFAGQVVT